MIQALLHGKLSREQENMEDILTSNVFGLLKHLPSERFLLPFLAQAQNAVGEKPLVFLLEAPFNSDAAIEYRFWPYLQHAGCRGCEPDLLLTLRPINAAPVMILVEAKYRSRKSSEADEQTDAPVDQLAREWDNLVLAARGIGARPVLVYLTADMYLPRSELEASASEWSAKRVLAETPSILWLSWRRLHGLVEAGAGGICQDLNDLLDRLSLTAFDGFGWKGSFTLPWRFSRGHYKWQMNSGPARWEFAR